MTGSPDHSEIKLIIRLRKGDNEAFHALFHRYRKRLHYYLIDMTKSEYIAEEILQEVFIKVWLHRENIKKNTAFSSYIHKITRNQVFNYWKKVAHQAEVKKEFFRNLMLEHNQTENTVITKDYFNLAEKIINRLPPQKKSIFILSRREGKSHEEIALQLGISTKTVRNHLWEALQLIKQQLRAEAGITLPVLLVILFP